MLPMSEFASEPRCSRTRAARSAPAPLRPVRFPEPRAQGHRGRAATLLPRIVVAPACPEAPQSAPFSAALFRAFVGYAACPEAPRSTPCAALLRSPRWLPRVPKGTAVDALCRRPFSRALLVAPRAQRHRGRRPVPIFSRSPRLVRACPKATRSAPVAPPFPRAPCWLRRVPRDTAVDALAVPPRAALRTCQNSCMLWWPGKEWLRIPPWGARA